MNNPKPINKKTFEGLLTIQCTREECCLVLGVAKNTLQKWVKENYDGLTFEKVSEQFRAFGKSSLRKNLFRLSEHNAAVAIFLAKNYLGMSDDPQPFSFGDGRRELDSAIREGLKALKENAENLASFPMKDGQNGQ